MPFISTLKGGQKYKKLKRNCKRLLHFLFSLGAFPFFSPAEGIGTQERACTYEKKAKRSFPIGDSVSSDLLLKTPWYLCGWFPFWIKRIRVVQCFRSMEGSKFKDDTRMHKGFEIDRQEIKKKSLHSLEHNP